MVGGVDYSESQFNWRIHARDKPGSASTVGVLRSLLLLDDLPQPVLLPDTPVSYPNGYRLYSPRNYEGSFMGKHSHFRTALEAISQRTSG